MSENPRPTKRTKYRACDSCVTSKTRCDDVTAEGCLVCRKRNKPCSLTESLSVDGRIRASPSVVEETTVELRNRLELVEARAWDMEQRLRAMEHSATPHLTSQGPFSDPTNPMASSQGPTPVQLTDTVEDVDTLTSRLVGRHHMGSFDERLFSPIDVKGYPDAVARGLVSPEQVDMAFQVFKHRFSKILPFPPFLLSTTPVPTHPFIITAMLVHVPTISGGYIAGLVDESIRHVVTGAVNLDVVLALLILALCPAQPGQMSGPSSLRVISLAHEIGHALGLEFISRAAAKRPAQLCEPWWSELLDRVLLWEAVKLTYNVIHLTFAKIDSLKPSIVSHLIDHPVYSYHISTLHLKALAELVDIFRRAVDVLAEAEAEALFSHVDVIETLGPWSEIIPAVSSFRARHPDLEITLELLLFAVGIRGTFWVQTLPTPIVAESKGIGYAWVYNHMLPAAFDVIKRYNATTQDLPRYQLLLVVMAISSGRRIVHFYSVSGHPPPHDFDFDEVSKAEAKMYALGGGVARALHKVQSAFKDEPTRLAQRGVITQEQELGMAFDAADLSTLFNLDFGSWESLFGGMGGTSTGAEYDQGGSIGPAGMAMQQTQPPTSSTSFPPQSDWGWRGTREHM